MKARFSPRAGWFEPMNVIVTGGNSFLAGHLISFLVSHGATVFASYRKPDSRLDHLQGLPGVHLVQVDVSERDNFGRLPRQADAVVHIAGASVDRPGSIGQFISCNVVGAGNVARYAKAVGAKKLVYTSSISVYGEIRVPVLQETYPITNPDDYGLTKYLAERLFAETEDLPCVALRLPGILGKGAHRAWIPSLLHRVMRGERKATIYSPESFFNNAAHVDDISQFIWALLNAPITGFEAVNVAADDRMMIGEVIELMAEMLNEKIEVTIVPAPKPSFTILSNRAKELGYKTRSIRKMLRCYFEESRLGKVMADGKVN
jgi:nucleoside-diphosphate-sugar epimerase